MFGLCETVENGSVPLDEFHTPKQLMVHTGTSIKCTSAGRLASAVSEDLASLETAAFTQKSSTAESRVLVLYTGGTIGMKCVDDVYCPEPYYLPKAIRELPPLNDKEYIARNYGDARIKPYCLPPVKNVKKRIVYWMVEYEPLLDSSDMTFDDWIRIGGDIRKAYDQYNGFVVLHGTDTLAYTACALSFMLENLGKPVIITGAQIPVCEVRSDGRENLVGALIMAANYDIPEVTVYFNNKLLRGNRSTKLDNSALEAFDSPNMAPLAEMKINVKVNHESIFRSSTIGAFTVHERLCRNVGLLRIFPSMSIDSVRAFLCAPTQGVVLQTFGAGNMPSKRTDIIEEIKRAVDRGCIVVNCSQCVRGQVDVHYLTGKILYDVGVIPGSDMTTEAALLKLAYVLSKDEWDLPMKRKMMLRNLRGELTIAQSETLHELEIIPRLAKFLRIGSSKEVQLLRDALYPPLLCHAASAGDIELLEHLRESGAILSTPDYNGRTALHVAASKGHGDVVRYLLSKGVSVHLKDNYDENALMSAIRSKNLACIEALRDDGACPVGDPIDIGVELCLLASRGDRDGLQAWIAAGIDIDEKDYDGRTALHIAVSSGNEELVAFLLANGANPKNVDNAKCTPIDEADRRGLHSVAEMLTSKYDRCIPKLVMEEDFLSKEFPRLIAMVTMTESAPQLIKRVATLTRDSSDELEPIDKSHTPKQLLVPTGSKARVTSATHLASVVSEDLAVSAVDNLHVSESRVLVLYTGGTIGMKKNGKAVPVRRPTLIENSFDIIFPLYRLKYSPKCAIYDCYSFGISVYHPEPLYLPQVIRKIPHLNDQEYVERNHSDAYVKPYCLPPLKFTDKRIVYWMSEYDPLLDSSDVTLDDWIRIGIDIRKSYDQYDGFVILHGTDTLAYTASALSFMLEHLGKPVVITGAQIPICEVRSDGRDNLIGALVVAGCFDIPEVTIHFNHKLLRGNRSTKLDNTHMEAFDSPNMSPIANLGITINVNFESVFRTSSLSSFKVQEKLCRDVSLLHIFPSISISSVRAALQPPTQGIVLQSYGCGNMPSKRCDIIAEIQAAIQRGCIVVNCSQCLRGMVDEQYENGKILYDIGVISGADMTIEAAMTKLMYVIAKDEWDLPTKRRMMQHNLRGEMTVARSETLQDLEIIPRLATFLRVSSSEEIQLLRNALFPPLLCHAARNGDLELLENLRDSGAILSAVDYNGRSPLHVAASSGHTDVVLYLLKHGANVHARCILLTKRDSVICQVGAEMFRISNFMDGFRFTNFNYRDQWGDNPLMNAIRRRNLACIKALKEADAVIICNPLELGLLIQIAYIIAAVASGSCEMVEFLLRNGADPRKEDNFGRDPMKEAEHAEPKSPEIISVLEEYLNKSKATFSI
ncbi:unnamed protein product [Anisakis simplex]|uniref:asparaginase n=1 Tax=Anisakis simplex TaxID=6269 RepID=A0A0M3K351_ANISI|nr:unnamed protein product [Anisakis simplex]